MSGTFYRRVFEADGIFVGVKTETDDMRVGAHDMVLIELSEWKNAQLDVAFVKAFYERAHTISNAQVNSAPGPDEAFSDDLIQRLP